MLEILTQPAVEPVTRSKRVSGVQSALRGEVALVGLLDSREAAEMKRVREILDFSTDPPTWRIRISPRTGAGGTHALIAHRGSRYFRFRMGSGHA